MIIDVPQPPKRPWTKGTHEDHEVLHLVVEVCQDSQGRVFSAHRPEEQDDSDMALSWKSGGLEQAAFALLTEAVRREASLQAIMLKSKPDLFTRLEEADGDEREKLVEDLRKRLEFQLQEVITRMSREAVEEALLNVSG